MATGTSKTQYLEDKLLSWAKGTAFPAAPATIYLALFTAAPTDVAATGTEVSGNAYARQAITWGAITQAAAGTGDSIANSAAVLFPAATPAGYTVVAVGVYDALTVGNLLWYGAITSTPIAISGQFNMPIGNLTIAED